MSVNTTLTWTPGSGNTSYIVEYKKTSASLYTTAPGSPVSTATITINGLDEGTSYDFRITGVCPAGNASPTINTSITTCKNPTNLVATMNTSSALLTWDNKPEHVSYKIEYKLHSDSTWTIAPGSPESNANPSQNSFTISGLTPASSYDFRITTNCVASTSTPGTTVTASTTGVVWVENTYVCEQSTGFTQALSVSGLSSPNLLVWDDPNSRFIVCDEDDTNGNFWWFDPTTFTSSSGRNYFPSSTVPDGGVAGSFNYIQSQSYDPVTNRIFVAGPGTGGLMYFDIPTGTLNGPIANTGTSNAAFARLFTKVIGSNVYTSNRATAETLYIVDTTTLTSTANPISGITNGATYMNNSYTFFVVNGEIWACASAGRSLSGDIARYSLDLTTFIGTITLPGVATAFNSRYWQSQFFDADYNRFYVSDFGSSQIFVIDTTTNNIVQTIHITNRRGKTYSYVGWILNPITGDLYAAQTDLNSTSDISQGIRYYILNRTTYQYTYMFKDQTTASFTVRPGMNEFWSANPGTARWDTGSTALTDGFIYKYTL